jgi:hypothetical protein
MGKPWFRVKRYGVGAGMPCSWEGWAVTAAFLALVFGVGAFTDDHPAVRLATTLIAIGAFIVIARLKSDAPWKWRWGGE